MNIELKNIKHFPSMSEETEAFTADLFINGKKIAYVKNEGCGGETYYQTYSRELYPILMEAEEFCSKLAPLEDGGFSTPMNLEHKIDGLLYDYLIEKARKAFVKKKFKDMEKGLIYTDNGTDGSEGYKMISWKGYTIPQLLKMPNGKPAVFRKIEEFKELGYNILNTNIEGI